MAGPLRYSAWLDRLQFEPLPGALLFCGPETLLRDQALAVLKERLFSSEDLARLCHDRFYGGEGQLAQVTAALASVGLFAGKRLVTLTDPEKFGRAGVGDRKELLTRLRQGFPQSCFVAISELTHRELQGKNEFTRGLGQACTVVEFLHPRREEAMRWLLQECKRRGLRVEAAAGEYLLARIGPNLQELSRELEKLDLAAEPGIPVGLPQIDKMVQRGQLGTGWEFVEAVLSGRTAVGLRQWSAIREDEPVLRLQWLLQRQARDRLARAGSGSPLSSFRHILLHAYELERGIKSGRIPSGQDGTALECLIVSLGTHMSGRAGRTQSIQTRGGSNVEQRRHYG